ncbi:MAG TPA: efflux RND transporter periplasmic adaptor subunit [Terriglobales bacterium]|nr:efflux RND transporter periplasmic adaptor subunit [Terriglobales bacterium]
MAEEIKPAAAQHSSHPASHAGAHPSTPAREPEPPQKSRVAGIAALVVLALVVAGGFVLARRLTDRKALAAETEELAVPTVTVIEPSAEKSADELTLPATLQAYTEAPIYSRTNGYLVRWYKDIGSRVRKGELLADIDTPEVDQELRQARAARQQIAAQLQLAKSTAERWENLRKTDAVSQQEADQQTSAYQQALANLAAADANVKRLEEMESFKHIYAPFAGVLTRRDTDIGALVAAGSGAQTKPLFDVAQVDVLRVYVSIPESYAPSVHPGLKAALALDEFPGQKFTGTVVRTADAIDPSTRTLNTEVDVPNRDGRLIPGAYAQVHFDIPLRTQRISVPVNALLFRSEGVRAAVVGPDGKVHLKPVVIGRDFGTKVEIVSGLGPSDRVVINPADSLSEGDTVKVAQGKGE